MSEPEINLTASAAKRVPAIAERQGRPAILRLSVDGGGCAGFTYKFELGRAPADDDAVAETDGVRLVVDPISLDLVERLGGRFRRRSRRRRIQGHQPQRRLRLRLRVEFLRLNCGAKATGMQLTTFNLNGIRARLPRLLEWLERENRTSSAYRN